MVDYHMIKFFQKLSKEAIHMIIAIITQIIDSIVDFINIFKKGGKNET